MMIVRFRTTSDAKDMLRKLKKMQKFTKELAECIEDKVMDEDEDEDYRMDSYEDEDESSMNRNVKARYRRGRY